MTGGGSAFHFHDAPMAIRDRNLTGSEAVQFAHRHPEIFSSALAFDMVLRFPTSGR